MFYIYAGEITCLWMFDMVGMPLSSSLDNAQKSELLCLLVTGTDTTPDIYIFLVTGVERVRLLENYKK